MTLLGFPLDSVQTGYHDDGYPAYSNEYVSKDYRAILATLVSDGVIAGAGSEMKVVAEGSLTGQVATVKTKSGAAVLNGCFAVIPSSSEGEKWVVNAPSLTGDETTKKNYNLVGIKFNGENVNTVLGQASGHDPAFSNDTLYLARVISTTTKNANGSYTYSHMIQDLRASEHCGWAAPFAEIDTSAYYDAVQQVVEESKAEVEATIPTLIENAQDSVDNAIAELEEQTQNAVDLAQSAIDGTAVGELASRIDGIDYGSPLYLRNTGTEIIEETYISDLEPGKYFIKNENINLVKDKPNTYSSTDTELIVLKVSDRDMFNIWIADEGIITRKITESGEGKNIRDWASRVYRTGLQYVTTNSIYDSAITTQKLADGSVTEDKLADSSVSLDKLTQAIRDNLNKLTDTGWVVPDSRYGGMTYRVKNGFLTVNIAATLNISATGLQTIFTLPAGSRPTKQIVFPAQVKSQYIPMYVNTDGTVQANFTATGNNVTYATVTVPL